MADYKGKLLHVQLAFGIAHDRLGAKSAIAIWAFHDAPNPRQGKEFHHVSYGMCCAIVVLLFTGSHFNPVKAELVEPSRGHRRPNIILIHYLHGGDFQIDDRGHEPNRAISPASIAGVTRKV